MTEEAIRERLARVERGLGAPFAAPWWLRNRHAQTLFGPLLRRRRSLPFEREHLATPDGDRLALHHLGRHPGAPRVLLLHGLEGSRRSNYIGGTALRLQEHGFDVSVLEFRSCDGQLNHAPRLYHSGETGDLELVVEELVSRRPRCPLYLSGVSLGANVLLKWLGERSADLCPEIAGAAAVCAPYDLTVSGPAIDRTLGGFYSRHFLRTLVPKALAKAEQFPGCLDRDRVARCRTIEEFDTHATAALHGFEDAWDYWRQSSCGPLLERIRRPTLLISARDDPFNPDSTLPLAAVTRSPWLLARFPERGGHVGFVEGSLPWTARWWAEECVGRFFGALEGERDRATV